jgi:hypothetical protein
MADVRDAKFEGWGQTFSRAKNPDYPTTAPDYPEIAPDYPEIAPDYPETAPENPSPTESCVMLTCTV